MTRTCLAASLGGVALVGDLAAGSAIAVAARSTSYPLRIEFHDSMSIRVSSDGAGAYEDGVDAVTATLDGGTGTVYFETTPWSGRGSVRRLHLDFSGLDTGAAGLGLEAAEVYSYLKAQSLNDVDLRALRNGEAAVRTFYVQWPRDAQSSGYRLDWYPANGGYIAVACTDPAASGAYEKAVASSWCRNWEARPMPPSAPAARLRAITGVKKGLFQFERVCPATESCLYDMPFVMRIEMI